MKTQTLMQIDSLSRHYGNNVAVDNVSFQVRRGEILGFLGPNGAGKSTTMQMIAGVLAPSTGSIQIAGINIHTDPGPAKQHIGFLPEQPPVYTDLSVDEYLHYCAHLRHIPGSELPRAIDASKSRCGLEQVGKRLIGNLSRGYQQRVGIAQAIIHNPAAIILDEPTSGLDPIQIKEIRELMHELGQDHSILLSTHILSEVQSLCDRVVIINQGKLVLDQAINRLQKIDPGLPGIELTLAHPPDIADLLAIDGVKSAVATKNNAFRLEFEAGHNTTDPLLNAILTHRWELLRLSPLHDSLESMFIQLTLNDNGATK